MATINSDLPTMLDQIKKLDPDGSTASVVESLTRRNAILADAVFMEGNLPTGHRFTSRTALPSVAFRRFNEGVAPSKGRTSQVDEACGMLTGFSVVDVDLADLGGNAPAFRAGEDNAFTQSLNNQAETSFIYSSTKTAPEAIMGLSPRLDATTGPAGSQIIKCHPAAAGNDQTSIWLVSWSPETVFGIYPKGSKVGIEQKDLGVQLWDDGSGKKFDAYVTKWNWKFGLCVKDSRYLVRIANVDNSLLVSTDRTIIEAMVKAYHQMQDTKTGRLAFYVNRTVGTYLHLQALNSTTNSTLTIEKIGGQPVTHFLGVPVRETDALLNSEAVVA